MQAAHHLKAAVVVVAITITTIVCIIASIFTIQIAKLVTIINSHRHCSIMRNFY